MPNRKGALSASPRLAHRFSGGAPVRPILLSGCIRWKGGSHEQGEKVASSEDRCGNPGCADVVVSLNARLTAFHGKRTRRFRLVCSRSPSRPHVVGGALELKAPDMVINVNTFMPALTAALSMDRLRKLKTDDWDRLSVLVRLVAVKDLREARSLLRERMYDPNVRHPVRRELAEAVARTASDAEIVEMLDSGDDVLTATAIDWAGDRQVPAIRSRVDRMLAESKKYWGTDTGSAIGEVGFLRLLIKRWETNPNFEARLDIVCSSPAFMFDGRNRSWAKAPRNTCPVAG